MRRTVTPRRVGIYLTGAAVIFALGTFFWISRYQSYMSDDFCVQVAARENSLLAYLTNAYETWNGRLLPSTVAYLMLPHRLLFAVANTIVLVGIVATVFRLALSRWPKSTLRDATLLVVLLGVFWFGTPVQDQTLMWRVGAFNYSWVLLLGLLFMVPYESWLTAGDDPPPRRHAFLLAVGMFFFGVMVGLSHEQMVAAIGWLGCCLLAYAVKTRRIKSVPLHLWSGAAGILLGLGVLLSAPGYRLRIGEEPAWVAADRMAVLKRFAWQAFEKDWAAGYMWLGLLLVLGLGVTMAAGMHGRKKGDLARPLAFFSAALIILLPLFFSAWSTTSRATFFSFALVVTGVLALMPMRENTVLDTLSEGSLVTLALFVALLLAADSGFEIRQTRVLENEVRWRRSMIVDSQAWGGNMVLPRIQAKTRRFQNFAELDTDPEHWRNRAMAEYYGMSSLRVEEEE